MSKGWKIIIIGLVLVVVVGAIIILYRHVFEFDNATVRALINNEANKASNPAAARRVIMDSVNEILMKSNLVQEVKDYAKEKGMSLEQALVTAAVAEAQQLYPKYTT